MHAIQGARHKSAEPTADLRFGIHHAKTLTRLGLADSTLSVCTASSDASRAELQYNSAAETKTNCVASVARDLDQRHLGGFSTSTPKQFLHVDCALPALLR